MVTFFNYSDQNYFAITVIDSRTLRHEKITTIENLPGLRVAGKIAAAKEHERDDL
jgi:hypothetical protein